MTKDDFYIIRNSVTMEQVLASYGISRNRKGMISCPFHEERTASMSIKRYGYRCFGCGASGDMIKFVSGYENLTPHEAGLMLADRFNIPISEKGEVDEETRRKAQQAILRHERELHRQEQIRAELKQIAALLHGYQEAVKHSEPYSDPWCYCQNEIPVLKGKWDLLFSEMRRN